MSDALSIRPRLDDDDTELVYRYLRTRSKQDPLPDDVLRLTALIHQQKARLDELDSEGMNWTAESFSLAFEVHRNEERLEQRMLELAYEF